ncbi:unnamed protein product [Phytomonas sp. Hart1]|nr:unnamed protein product [Phytomonas sp. Hart1]|eukprot:CCW72270.1 unnamed protein product [Phytomonas sp. isolate Hart1]
MLPQPKLRKTPFLQFRAGKMTYVNKTVLADKRKGYLSFIDDGADIIELIWSSESSDTDLSLPLKKGEVEVQFVEKCTTGRVLLFKTGKGTNQGLHFFWLQDKSTEKDSSYLENIKAALTPKKDSSTTAPRTIQLAELQKLISSISSSSNDISLRKLMHSTKITEALLEEPDFYYDRIKGHLSENEIWNPKDITKELKNPHITRALDVIETALKDPQAYRALCRENNLPVCGTGVIGFLYAIVNSMRKPT